MIRDKDFIGHFQIEVQLKKVKIKSSVKKN